MLEWTFSPHDYFEQVIEITGQGYTMMIGNDGHAQAKIESSLYEANPDIREIMQNDLKSRFLGVQLLTYRPYKLSDSKRTRLHPGGRKDYFIEPKTAHFATTFYDVDTKIIKDGNVVADSKQDRIEEKKRYAELVASCRTTDPLLESLLQSYQAAIDDSDDELVHLYEIRDAFCKKFKAEAQKALGLTRAQWSRFGRLCNDEPLRQGRHRGKTSGLLRDATESELADARGFAKAMIKGYLDLVSAPKNH
jgi:hypothetical protein